MSRILDALRRGRTRHVSQFRSDRAQTETVLYMLAYGRPTAERPWSGSTLAAGYCLVAVMFAAVVWGAAIWMTQPAF